MIEMLSWFPSLLGASLLVSRLYTHTLHYLCLYTRAHCPAARFPRWTVPFPPPCTRTHTLPKPLLRALTREAMRPDLRVAAPRSVVQPGLTHGVVVVGGALLRRARPHLLRELLLLWSSLLLVAGCVFGWKAARTRQSIKSNRTHAPGRPSTAWPPRRGGGATPPPPRPPRHPPRAPAPPCAPRGRRRPTLLAWLAGLLACLLWWWVVACVLCVCFN